MSLHLALWIAIRLQWLLGLSALCGPMVIRLAKTLSIVSEHEEQMAYSTWTAFPQRVIIGITMDMFHRGINVPIVNLSRSQSISRCES